MRDPTARVLELLSLLQAPREWSGTELAERLNVTPRTIRRDVDRLRELGYPVHATQGNTGGYRLAAGAAMPPLVLDDDEAVAVAVGLRAAASAAVAGIEERSLRALAKLEQVLPARLRRRVSALAEATAGLPVRSGAAVDADILASVATACVEHEKIRFTYTTDDSTQRRRLAEPHALVTLGRRWYLVAHDSDRDDWRTFRLDRLTDLHRTGIRVAARPLPGDLDAATWVMDTLATRPGMTRATLLIHIPIERAAALIPSWQGVLEYVDEQTCRLTTGADSIQYLGYRIATLPVDYTLLHPPELAPHLRILAERAQHAIQRYIP